MTNLHDTARWVSSSLTSLGRIITTATPDPWTAVVSVASVGVKSPHHVALGSGRHVQVRPGGRGRQRGRIASDSRSVGRALGWRCVDGRIQEMSRHGFGGV